MQARQRQPARSSTRRPCFRNDAQPLFSKRRAALVFEAFQLRFDTPSLALQRAARGEDAQALSRSPLPDAQRAAGADSHAAATHIRRNFFTIADAVAVATADLAEDDAAAAAAVAAATSAGAADGRLKASPEPPLSPGKEGSPGGAARGARRRRTLRRFLNAPTFGDTAAAQLVTTLMRSDLRNGAADLRGGAGGSPAPAMNPAPTGAAGASPQDPPPPPPPQQQQQQPRP